jgi:hypothetical protein
MIDQEVASRVQEFKGKPQALQQQYATSQQLIDLLALQKIKSMQESAARQMQLQMAQQQAANGEASSTIAEQREKEVMDMTKNELAQQRGELMKQEQTEQQEAMKKLMGGIASAEGAASAMQPQAMAAGGIVAFKEGDGVKDERYKRKEGESLSDFNSRVLQLELEDKKAESAKRDADRESERQRMLAERGGAAIPPSRLFDRAPLPASVSPPAASQQGLGGLPNAQQAPRLPVSEAQATMQAGPQAAMPAPAPRPMAPPPPQVAQKPPMPAAPPAPPMPQQQQGLGSLQMGPPEDTLQNALRRQSIAGMNIDPKAEKLAEEKRIEDRLKLTPEQRAVFDEGIAGQKKFYDRDFDPETQRREGIKRYLLGMGGRSQGEFAGGAETAMNYDTAQKQQQRARFNEMQKSREGLIGLDRGAVSGGIEGGFKAYEQAGNTQRTALTSGANVFGTESQSKDNAARITAQTADNAAQREIEKLKINAQNAATAAARESNDISRVQSLLGSMLRDRVRAEEVADRPFVKQLALIDMTLQANPKDVNALKQKQAIELQREAARDAATKEIDMLRAQVEARLTGGVRPITGAKVEKLSK